MLFEAVTEVERKGFCDPKAKVLNGVYLRCGCSVGEAKESV